MATSGPLAREQHRHGRLDAAVAAGDQRHLVLQPPCPREARLENPAAGASPTAPAGAPAAAPAWSSGWPSIGLLGFEVWPRSALRRRGSPQAATFPDPSGSWFRRWRRNTDSRPPPRLEPRELGAQFLLDLLLQALDQAALEIGAHDLGDVFSQIVGVLPSRPATRSIAWVMLRLAAAWLSTASNSLSAQAASTVADQVRKSLAVNSPPATSRRNALTSADRLRLPRLVDVLEQLLPRGPASCARAGRAAGS